jgi:glutathione synthase
MNKIAFLIAETDRLIDGNYLRFGNELRARGFNVTFCLVDSIAMHGSEVVARGFTLDRNMADGDAFPSHEKVDLADFSYIWLLSLGFRQGFLDKIQLLYSINDSTCIINSLDVIMHLKSKYFLASRPDQFNYPVTHASTDPTALHEIVLQGGRWIAKPPAGSLGREVFLIGREDVNARVILETLCGPDKDRYTLLQRYVAEIEQGEKRVLFAGGKPVGQYRRIAREDHRTNIMQGASIETCELTSQEADYCIKLGAFLKDFGAGFVGLDLAYPWVIEFNVINPGGLLTIEELTGHDLTATILDGLGFVTTDS